MGAHALAKDTYISLKWYTINNNLHSMYYYGVVACSSLNFGHLVNDSDQCVYVTTPTICCPVSDLELAHVMRLTKLKKNSKL